MARKFLYVVAFLIVLTIAGALAYRLAGVRIIRWWAVPSAQFEALPGVDANAYADAKMWIARPDLPGNPALWTPAGYAPAKAPEAAVFFIHPTSFLGTARWNAALDDAETNARAALFLRGQASAFNEVGAIWAPRYRQATFGAFLTNVDAANQALDLAYRDVAAAFEAFLKQAGDRPIILAGHSQGALHLTRLLRAKVADDARLRKRIVAAYVVGWPVSRTTDLARTGIPECRTAAQINCLLSWQSFAAPADPSLIVDTFDATTGFDGRPRKGTPMVCTNPLTGTANGSAAGSANLGTLFPSSDLTSATIAAGTVGAKCDGRGFLLLDTAIELGPYLLPGNNYHVYDYSLFWANVRADAARRLAALRAVTGTSAEDFRTALPAGGRLIGLDLGTKTIGTALCDAGWSFASPALLVRRTKFQKDKAALAALIAAQAIRGLVIGLPINLDGSESPRSQSTRAFAQNLQDWGLPILLWDERWSTVAVERTMIEQDMSRARRAERIDNLAAAHILQAAIDALTMA